VTKPSWGTKRTCPSCSAHFYDLEKNPATCPKCAYSFDPSALFKPRRGRAVKRADVPAVPSATDMIEAEAKKQEIKKKAKAAMMKERGEADEGIDAGEGIEDMEELGEIEEIGVGDLEDTASGDDDADDETIMEELEKEGTALIDELDDAEAIEEEEELEEIEEELEEEEESDNKKRVSSGKKASKQPAKPAKADKPAKRGRR